MIQNAVDFITRGSSNVEDWWFMSPYTVIGTLIIYHILYRSLGKLSKPLELKNTLIVYNFIQILYSLALPIMSVSIPEIRQKVYWYGMDNEISDQSVIYIKLGVWSYYLFKLIDLLDTIFFSLRKKYNQISFLHLYHHTTMVLLSYYFLRYSFSYHTLIAGIINSLVHAIMYTYYLLAIVKCPPKYLWWKKYLTTVQIIQFGVIILIELIAQSRGRTTDVTIILIGLCITFAILFLNFYFTSYNSTKRTNGANKYSH